MTNANRPSAFRWNLGGWFGSCAGGLAWMLPLLWTYLASRDFVAAGVIFLVFLGVATAVVLAWRHRDKIAPYVAIQSAILCLGLAGLAAFVLAQWRPLPVGNHRTLLVIPLVAAGLSVRFWFLERFGVKPISEVNEDSSSSSARR